MTWTRALLLSSLAILLPPTATAANRRSTAAACIGWRQTGDCDPDAVREEKGDKDCVTTIPRGNSGYCECADSTRAGYVTCQHEQFNCEETCARTNTLGWLEDTVWLWNDWRNVEFRSGGIFFAPEDYCRDGISCKWSMRGERTIVIDWSGAGMHTVQLDSGDRKTMAGQRYDGDACHAEFIKRDVESGVKRHAKRREESGADEDDGTDMYSVLGVDPEAEESEIKKVYRRLSRKYHPVSARKDFFFYVFHFIFNF